MAGNRPHPGIGAAMKQRSLFQNPADELPGQTFLFDPEGWSEKSVSFSDRSDIPSGESDQQTIIKGDDEPCQ